MTAEFGKMQSELKQIRDDFDKYVSDERTRQSSEEERHKLAEKRQYWLGVLSGIIASAIGGLIVLAIQHFFGV